jgi:DNA-binding XRE family transcriptional regulator
MGFLGLSRAMAEDRTALENQQRLSNCGSLRSIRAFAKLLKTRRESVGFTKGSLTQKLGVARSHVAFLESGRKAVASITSTDQCRH